MHEEGRLMRSLLVRPRRSRKEAREGLSDRAPTSSSSTSRIPVAPENKPAGARDRLAFIAPRGKAPGARSMSRVNDLLDGPHRRRPRRAIVPRRPDGIMLPKSQRRRRRPASLGEAACHEAENGLPTAPPASFRSSPRPAPACWRPPPTRPPAAGLDGLTWGAEDLSAAIGARVSRGEDGRFTDVFRLRARIDAARRLGRRHGRASTPSSSISAMRKALRANACEADRDGFTAKMAIHPAQVPIINAVFTPSPEAIAARGIVVDGLPSGRQSRRGRHRRQDVRPPAPEARRAPAGEEPWPRCLEGGLAAPGETPPLPIANHFQRGRPIANILSMRGSRDKPRRATLPAFVTSKKPFVSIESSMWTPTTSPITTSTPAGRPSSPFGLIDLGELALHRSRRLGHARRRHQPAGGCASSPA